MVFQIEDVMSLFVLLLFVLSLLRVIQLQWQALLSKQAHILQKIIFTYNTNNILQHMTVNLIYGITNRFLFDENNTH